VHDRTQPQITLFDQLLTEGGHESVQQQGLRHGRLDDREDPVSQVDQWIVQVVLDAGLVQCVLERLVQGAAETDLGGVRSRRGVLGVHRHDGAVTGLSGPAPVSPAEVHGADTTSAATGRNRK
jgi:hypothetical protein